MKLSSKNIIIRALEPADLNFLFNTENNTSLWEVSNTQTPFSRHILKQYLANAHQDIYEAKQLRLIIETKNKAIGMVDFFNFEPQHKRAGIGIVINHKYQQKGFANEALKICINYAFSILNLHQIYANIASDNLKSIALFTKNNFKKIGIKKEWLFSNNTYKDEILYQLINKRNN